MFQPLGNGRARKYSHVARFGVELMFQAVRLTFSGHGSATLWMKLANSWASQRLRAVLGITIVSIHQSEPCTGISYPIGCGTFWSGLTAYMMSPDHACLIIDAPASRDVASP